MTIEELHKNWTALGENDPMWVVLTDPEKRGGKWRAEDFFATGRTEISGVLEKMSQAGLVLKRDRVLDFGCGLGRLSQALAESFAVVDGVDVSTSMIKQAKALNKFPVKVFYHLNVRADLEILAPGNYDFIYSNICLQHMPAKFQARYAAEFVRLLRPGGAAFFQTIHACGARRLAPDFAVDLYRKIKNRGRPFIPMHGIPVGRIRDAVENAGGKIHKIFSSAYAGHEARYVSDFFIATKPAAGRAVAPPA